MNPGRKLIEITPEMLIKVERLASQGMTGKQIAACLGFSEETLYVKIRTYPEFSEALKRGRALGIDRVTKSLEELVSEKNVTATIFFLKCKAGWKEAKEKQKDDKTNTESLLEKIIDKL